MVDRRTLLIGGLGAGIAAMPGISFVHSLAVARAPGERRVVLVVQRGAADGLGILAPTGDPAFQPMRGSLANETAGGAALDSMFTLHPALPNLTTLYRNGEALFVHAVGTPYRERSHFDGQNVLETGGTTPYALKTGWLQRLGALVPGAADELVAMSNTVPAVLRGGDSVLTLGPDDLPPVSEDLLASVTRLYESDPLLSPIWTKALASRDVLESLSEAGAARKLGQGAGELLAPGEPGRIAVIETGGWDTHTQQRGRLARQLGRLDEIVAGLQSGLGEAWNDTMVLIATEFGRTVRTNGSAGTDHGTASLAIAAGGAVRGGRVIADWPGLTAGALHQQRDLKPTTDLFALLGTLLAGHYAIEPDRAIRLLFPEHRAKAVGAVTA